MPVDPCGMAKPLQKEPENGATPRRRSGPRWRRVAVIVMAASVLIVGGCAAVNGAEVQTREPPVPSEFQEAELIGRIRIFVEEGSFSRESAERLLGMRFAHAGGAQSAPQIYALQGSDLPFVSSSCSTAAPSQYRTRFIESASGEPQELTVTYRRSIEPGAPLAGGVLRSVMGTPWICSVSVQELDVHSVTRIAAYLWRSSDAVVEVRKEASGQCAMVRVTRLHPSWRPPQHLRNLSCRDLPGASSGNE
ncbi:hypothetical protein LZ009_13495 [Ramlibacter sp. XY19]|uniref:hypothetical protein n=1 Tax=Ramlibacter paludis TaxID=2908000 RepID=UPI0023DC337D|nr:hypothetical protein [Ramlibacter paludis]MCG2593794.1 hypothetical protein [Ramlibacter paludis]